ncbi:MAG: Ig-like domain-containing protein [Deltaproteobacteria bacterium]|nr:Ig-like domain-containing protein [Deltaproteobacteria bacterium]
MFARVGLALPLLALSLTAQAQVGPGLGNLNYSSGEVFNPIGYIESPHGHGNVALVQGYLLVIYSSDGGGDESDGGLEFWDLSNPRAPVMVAQYDDPETHALREAHGFSLAWYGNQLLLAAQGELGVLIYDVTNPRAIQRLSYTPLPGIALGDYSGDWWLFWQAPYLYVAGVDQGLYVVDVRDPAAPALLAQVPTGDLGGVSPAQVFVLGNLAVVMESQSSAMATLDVAIPDQPRLLQQVNARAGYSHLLAGDGKILISGNIPPRAHFYQLTPDGGINYLDTVGFFFNSGGYGSYQDGFFHSGFSNNYVKFQINPPTQIGDGSSGRTDRDEDFASVLGNLVIAGDDHGVGTAIIPHQEAPDTNPPVVEWMHPPSGSTEVALSTRIGLSFSDQIDAASLNPSTLWLEDDGGNPVPAWLSVQQGLVNLAPVSELGLNRTYRIVAVGVRDVVGNPSPRFEGTITTGDGSVAQSPTAAVINVDVNVALGSYALGIFSEGKLVYSDRDYTFTAQYPARYERQAYLQTANVDRINFLSNFLSFELLAPAEVAVLYDARASSIPNWLGTFTPTGETVVTTDTTLDVYRRDFPAGPVNLGGNSALGASGAQSMYSVVIVPEPLPCEVDLSPALTGTITLSGTGPQSGNYQWRVAGRTLSGPNPSVFLPPGRHPITLNVDDGVRAASCSGLKIVHRPLVNVPARTASKLIWVEGHTLNVNPDHGSVSRVDPNGGVIWERAIGGRPEGLAQKGDELWVVDRSGARLVILDLDTGSELRTIPLRRASAPTAIVFAPDGRGYVSLYATGEVQVIEADGSLGPSSVITPTARGLTWFDGKLYVTRFISGDTEGEVHVLDASNLAQREVVHLPFDPGPDTEATGRGVPNYVAEVQIAPDGVTGFVASKKDNIARGLVRDGRPLTFESRARTVVSRFEIATASAAVHRRLDINDRELVLTTLISPLADLLFVASHGVHRIDVFDLAKDERVSQFDVGLGPQAMALDPAGERLAVFNFLSRSVSYYDVAGLLRGTRNAAPELATITTVASEPLSPVVLAGKRIFHDAADHRMSRDSYLSCATCHFEGGHDGRTWDFTQAGEGLRNTISLNGRAGVGHGRVHWTANFDELQDFEHDIRGAFGGQGYLSDADFAATQDPLGAPKAGRSAELDALAAYVATLTTFEPSPHREADGSLSADARRGRVVFNNAGCAVCHGGPTFSDHLRHDVGTIRPSSGQGLGQPLIGVGFDTPTLRGLWDGAPYLHDGSAATLEQVLDRHGPIPALAVSERAELLSYLLSLDNDSLPPEAPCEQGPNECIAAMGPTDAGLPNPDAQPTADSGGPDAGAADQGTPVDAGGGPPTEEGCGCTAHPSGPTGGIGVGLCGLLFLLRRRR